MIKNYLKTALRHLKMNKGYSFINMVGLSLGMTCAMLILLWVNDELQYDKFHKNYKQLYQVQESQHYEGKVYTFAALPGLFSPAIKSELPEIKYSARVDWGTRAMFSLGDKSIYEEGYFTDPDFLQMFSFPLLKGDTSKILQDLSSILITESMAQKFFGSSDNAMGKILKADNEKPLTVSGILKDPPINSSLKFSWLLPYKSYEQRNDWLISWSNNGIRTFVQLKDKADEAQVDKKMYDFIQKKDTGTVAKAFLHSIKDWRLRNRFEDGKIAGGRIEYVRLFSIIAVIIIIIACINFMNLATARSEKRAREVGVRKVMGAGRGMLIRQFFGESIVMAFSAMLIAALLVVLVLPAFNLLVEKKLSFDLTNPVCYAGLPLMALICGVLAGSYPSLYLSSFNPATVFRGLRVGKNSAVTYIRKGLVIAQFSISIILIISTIVIYRQIVHVKDRQLGFNKERILYTTLNGGMNEHSAVVRGDLMRTGVVEDAAVSNSRVLMMNSSSGNFNWQGKNQNAEVLITTESVGPHYISTMQMQLVKGRDFYTDGVSDTSNIIINETLAKLMGKENPVGELITRGNEKWQVTGVVKDFVYNDMYKKPEPLIFFYQPRAVNQMLIRLKSNTDITKALAKVEAVIKTHAIGYPFEYKFMDDEFDQLFRNESLIGKLSRVFSVLTILISCLGLFGLAAYTAERRTKEIGIRKVLGASVSNVAGLLSQEFLRLVIISAVIAFPTAWWMMNKFLENYSYRIKMEWWMFAIAGLLALIIALATVSSQAIKAALSNPVKSLRTE